MAWDNNILATHEAGHWVAAHVCGVPNHGVNLSFQDPTPGQVRIPRGRFISVRDRSLIAFAGVASEIIKFGQDKVDASHVFADVSLLQEHDAIDMPLEHAQKLLGRHEQLLDAVIVELMDPVSARQPTTVPNEVLAEVARNLGVDYGVDAIDAKFSEGNEWLVRACARFQQRQAAARDVAVTARNPSEFSATVKVSSNEPPGLSTFNEDWPAFELAVAESGFAVSSKTDDSHEGRIDLILKLSFTA